MCRADLRITAELNCIMSETELHEEIQPWFQLCVLKAAGCVLLIQNMVESLDKYEAADWWDI